MPLQTVRGIQVRGIHSAAGGRNQNGKNICADVVIVAE
jgi:hypothetical protein